MPNTFTSSGSAFVTTAGGYASASDVAALCRNLLGSQVSFGVSSSPTLTEVNKWLSSGCSIIETKLKGTCTTGTTAYDMVSGLNALYAAGQAEMSRINVTLSPGERTRGQVFLEQFWKELKEIAKLDLSSLGLSSLVTGGGGGILYSGGISATDKYNVESNTDRVTPRFGRGLHRTSGTLDPLGEDYDTDDE
jgi:hypothetical protein